MRVLLLHGLGADARAFQRFARLLPEGWSAAAIDLLGHGEAPKPAAGYALDDHAAYVAGRVARELGAWAPGDEVGERALVIGHSYGASIAVALAATYPNLVAGLVLLDPVVNPFVRTGDEVGGDGGVRERADGDSGTARMIRAKLAGDVTDTVEEVFAHEGAPLRAWIIETWHAMARGVVAELDPDWPRFAARVACPVAIVHGEVAMGGAGDVALEHLPAAQATCIEGAGHFLHATHARATAAAIVDAVEAMAGVA